LKPWRDSKYQLCDECYNTAECLAWADVPNYLTKLNQNLKRREVTGAP
jgi:hypothetical protein